MTSIALAALAAAVAALLAGVAAGFVGPAAGTWLAGAAALAACAAGLAHARGRAAAPVYATDLRMLAHDMRVPVSHFKILLGTLKRETDPAALRRKIDRLVPALEATFDKTERMLEELVHLEKAEALAAPAELPELELWSLLAGALRETLASRPDALALSLSLAHTRKIRGDLPRLFRVLTNLLGNAGDAAGSGGRLWIRTADAGETCRIVIGNSGRRIAAADAERVFDPFYSRGKRGGSGLGLAIVKKYAELHGGGVACRPVEGGTEFELTLPLAPSPAAPPPGELPATTKDLDAALRTMADTDTLRLDQFRMIADWFHPPLRELTRLPGATDQPAWYAARLGIPESLAALAIERMTRLGLLVAEGGRLRQKSSQLALPGGVPSESVRAYHEGMIGLAREAVRGQSIDERFLTALVFPFASAAKMEAARQKILAFIKDFDDLTGGDEADAVYGLTLQLFRLGAPPPTR